MAAFALFYSGEYRAALCLFQAELNELDLSLFVGWKYFRFQCLLMIAACHHHLYIEEHELQSLSGEVKACFDLISLLSPNSECEEDAFNRIASQYSPSNLISLIRSHVELLVNLPLGNSVITLSAQPLVKLVEVKWQIVPHRWPLGADFEFEIQLDYPSDFHCDSFECCVLIEYASKNVTFGNSDSDLESDSQSKKKNLFPCEIVCTLSQIALHPGRNLLLVRHRPPVVSSSSVGDETFRKPDVISDTFFQDFAPLEPMYQASRDILSVREFPLRLSVLSFKIISGCLQMEESDIVRNAFVPKKSSIRSSDGIPCTAVASQELLSKAEIEQYPRFAINISSPHIVDRLFGIQNQLGIIATIRPTNMSPCQSQFLLRAYFYLKPKLRLHSPSIFAVIGSDQTCSACLSACSRLSLSIVTKLVEN